MKIVLFFILVLSHFTYGQTCDPNLYSLSFDGSSSYVEINPSDTFNLTTKITVEAWIKAYKWADTYEEGSIVCKHGWTQAEKGYVIRAGGDGQLSFNIAYLDKHGTYKGWKEVLSQPGAIQINTWYHVAGVFDGDKLQLYINGMLVKEVNAKGSIVPSPYKLKIGRIADDGASNKRHWNGLIDEVRIWNVRRNDNEIRDNMSHHISPSSQGLIGYWRFTEGSGLTAASVATTENATLIESNWNMDVPFTNGVPKPEISFTTGVFESNSVLGNQWNLNGVPISGATNSIYLPEQAGYYSVTVDYGAGCIATSEQIYFSSVGIGEIFPREIKFSIHDHELIFNDLPEEWCKAELFVCDMKGRIVLRDKIIKERFELDNFSRGVYLLSVFVKQKRYSIKVFLE